MSQDNSQKPYPEVPAQPKFPEIEQRVLARWREDRTFERSVENRPAGEKGANEFVFYDGPPFANGKPHFGHLVTSYVKDIVPRYQTLRGRRVERRFGWDCHGLPAEMEAQKELGVSSRAEIEAYGVDRFNDYCRSSVLRYTEHWQEVIHRAGRWVDFGNDYKTMDLSYMESVIWAFKQLHQKDLLYEGFNVLPYSWAAETPLSNFETRLDDATRERTDPAITVRFELVPDGDDRPTDLLAWTTTPWTLPSNLALAVGPEIDYAVLEHDGQRTILAEALVAKFEAELGSAERIGSVRGSELVGRRYRPLFPFFEGTENAFQVLGADFVEVEEGTGVVHLAPGFGEDDLRTCKEHDIPVVVPVNDQGRFTAEVPAYEGQLVFDANAPIIRDLKERGVLVRRENYVHNYPHCWRTDEPLIYRAMTSWFVRVSAIRDRMLENNQEINWIPEHIRDGLFGNMLGSAPDWALSRNRFWGSPIPVWKSDDPAFPRIDVYGSLDEIEEDFGVRPDDLHRPAIDGFVRPNPDDPSGRAQMRRVSDVLDVWFDSGSMPFAQVHYPFENKEWFENHFPADFICEYVAQTRGWFNTMMVLGTALFDRPPFRNCICHGVAVDTQGTKLSKRLRNYPEPSVVYETHGSDAMRWYLVSSPLLKGGDLKVEIEGKPIGDVVRNVLNPLWSAWHFFSLYANADDLRGQPITSAENVLDRYVLAKTRDFVLDVQARMDAYDIQGACGAFTGFLDALNNWYVRRSRPRFWKAEKDADKQAAYDTLATVLSTLCRTVSPLLPFVTDEIYLGLVGGDSIHLSDWPDAEALPADPELVAAMDRVRDVCSTAFAMRRGEQVRIRQPLQSLTIAGPDVAMLEPFTDLIADEVNVKEVRLRPEIDAFATFRLQVNARVLGPRLGGDTKQVIAASKRGEWASDDDGHVTVAGHRLEAAEFTLLLQPKEDVACQALSTNDMVVVLDFELTEALVNEGHARDLVRVVQQARREAAFDVSDRIHLSLALPEIYRNAVSEYQDYVAESTLAVGLELNAGQDADGFLHEAKLGGEAVQIWVRRAEPA
ncbi:MAG: isoleucine--tRNA ligase [Deltaproteobacteria bacterium]|nr:isoleucine--tRNA ligase [Deltaproteobacteria bacterium]MBW2393232.1 isoleucine--tRNA ligase [Deltaproteobacteria bacterium]